MAVKKIFTIATEEYVNKLIEAIELTPGPDGKSAYEIAVEQGFEGSEKEWLKSLVGPQGDPGKDFVYEDFTEEQLEALRGPQGEQGEQGIQGEVGPQGEQGPTGKFDMESLYDILQTEDKTVIGAINELFTKINDWLHPNCDLKAQMFYGVIDPTASGVITSYSDITVDMLSNSNSIKSTIPGERIALSMGYVKEGSYIVIAVPTMYDFNVTKDNGFGGKVAFDDDIVGANGIDVEFNGVDYRIYGELALVSGERFVYIETPKQNPGVGGDCGCYDISIEDIDDIMSDLFK